jgi:hypothetical protein
MYHNRKKSLVLATSSLTNGATGTGSVDTIGYDRLELTVLQTTSNNTTNNLSVCKLSESDTTDATNYSDITKFVGDGTGGFTVPVADTSNSQLYVFNLDLRARKRYIKLTVSPVTTQSITAIASLSKAEQMPVTAADANVGLLVEG